MLQLVIGVILGFLSSVGHDYLKLWHRGKRHWKVVYAAALLCEARANNYINRTVAAPLYRMPTKAFHDALPVLMGDSGMTEKEYKALVEYFEWADDINRGLEYASEAARSRDNERLSFEEGRLDKKCRELISVYLPPLKEALDARV